VKTTLQRLPESTRLLARGSSICLLLTLGIITACKAKEDKTADSLAAIPLPAPATSDSGTALDSGAGRVTEYGIGRLRAGMSFAEANDSLKGALKTVATTNLAECDYVKWEGGPPGLNVMVVGGKIARVETSDTLVTTAAGARVGDSEDRIKSLYPGRVTVSPHKYADGHYLTVKSANAADSLHFIIFETDRNKVTTFRAGIMPAVAYIEGCS
jgi:hypothetical protein